MVNVNPGAAAPGWKRIEAGVYSRRIGLKQRLDVVLHYNAFVRSNRWVASHVVEGEKSWMREERTEIRSWPTLKEAKAGLKDWSLS